MLIFYHVFYPCFFLFLSSFSCCSVVTFLSVICHQYNVLGIDFQCAAEAAAQRKYFYIKMNLDKRQCGKNTVAKLFYHFLYYQENI